MKVLSVIAAVLILASLSGCAHVVYRDRLVDKPYVVYKAPPLPAATEREEIPVFLLPPEASDKEFISATAESLLILLNHEKQQTEALRPFREREDGKN